MTQKINPNGNSMNKWIEHAILKTESLMSDWKNGHLTAEQYEEAKRKLAQECNEGLKKDA